MKTVMLTFAVQIPDDHVVNLECGDIPAVNLLLTHGNELIAISCSQQEYE